MRYGQLVIGPAGSGKSTYCHAIQQHCETINRTVYVVNLDPAAEHFEYPVIADIRELVHIDDVMEDKELNFGPNGGLVFCMEFFLQNLEWLEEKLGSADDDYIIFDCPGQIELYTHIPAMKQFTQVLKSWDFNICSVFLLDSHFIADAPKMFSGIMTALSSMILLELPHINILSKIDLISPHAKKTLDQYLDPDPKALLEEVSSHVDPKYMKLNKAISNLISDFSLVQFLPLDITDEESKESVLLQIDMIIQYGEDLDVNVKAMDGMDEQENYNCDM